MPYGACEFVGLFGGIYKFPIFSFNAVKTWGKTFMICFSLSHCLAVSTSVFRSDLMHSQIFTCWLKGGCCFWQPCASAQTKTGVIELAVEILFCHGVCVSVSARACVCVCAHVCVYVCVFVCMCVHTCIYACIVRYVCDTGGSKLSVSCSLHSWSDLSY